MSELVELTEAKYIDLSQFGLRTKEELQPDISLYQGHRELSRFDDVLRMTEMPLLVIEILSPQQTLDELLAKFKAYFTLGIKSYWLVTPAIKAITVYSSSKHLKTFSMNYIEVID